MIFKAVSINLILSAFCFLAPLFLIYIDAPFEFIKTFFYLAISFSALAILLFACYLWSLRWIFY